MNLSEEYKTKVLNKKWGNLFLLINIIHFLIPIYIYIYPLLFKNTLGDHLYIGFMLILVIHWGILKNECIINYFEKKM